MSDLFVKSGARLPPRERPSKWLPPIGIPVPDKCIAVVGISGDPEEVQPFGVLTQRITSLLIRGQELSTIATTQSEQRSYIRNDYLRQEIRDQQYLEAFLA